MYFNFAYFMELDVDVLCIIDEYFSNNKIE